MSACPTCGRYAVAFRTIYLFFSACLSPPYVVLIMVGGPAPIPRRFDLIDRPLQVSKVLARSAVRPQDMT